MKVELSLSAKHLQDVETGLFKGVSDPFAIVTLVATDDTMPQVLGRTETVQNCLNPDWTKTFDFDYELGNPTYVVVSLYDDNKKKKKSMGSVSFDIGQVLAQKGNVLAKRLRSGGTIIARVEKSHDYGKLQLQLRADNLKNVESLFRKSDPMFEIQRKQESGWDVVFRSNVVKDDLSPKWNPAIMSLYTICGGNVLEEVRIAVYDYEKDGKHDLIGHTETTILTFLHTAGTNKPLILQMKGKETGSIYVSYAKLIDLPLHHHQPPPLQEEEQEVVVQPAPPIPVKEDTFMDYITGGCELDVSIAIDFTASNGNPRKPSSLHYYGQENDYDRAIFALSKILTNFDSNQMITCLGFGAKLDGKNLSNCFSCSSQKQVHGVDGVMNAYHNVFKRGIVMSNPTDITEIVSSAATHSTDSLNEAIENGKQIYTVLLILTDGHFSDMENTLAVLEQVKGSAPLSIVIIGIGPADFSSMSDLGENAQFVSFEKYKNNPRAFTSHALNQIPQQLLHYFKSRGIKPLPPIRDVQQIPEISYNEDDNIDVNIEITEDEIVVTSGGITA